jgi:hexosaminidase
VTRRVVFAALWLLVAPAARAELRLVPEPRSVRPGAGSFALKGTVAIAVPSNDPEDRFAAELLKAEIESAGGAHATIAEGGAAPIVLARDERLADAGDEGYRIESSAGGVRVSARTAAGLFYGVQTLRQMVGPDGIPAATITDRPALRWRGIQDDVSRGPMPTVESLERRIRTAAELKVNFYVLYLENAFAYRGHPLLGTQGESLTESDVRELVAFARRHHVVLVPEQQTTSHLRSILQYETYGALADVPGGSALSATNPQSYVFIRSLYDELAPLFPGPFLHVGADEIGGAGPGNAGAAAPADSGRAYFDHLRRLHDLLAPLGRRLLFWGDYAVRFPALLRSLPPDMIAASWEYGVHASYDEWIRPFRDARLEVMVCPGASNWSRPFPNLDLALPDIRAFTRDGQRLGAIGQLDCTWNDSGDALFGLSWYPLAYGAACAWQEGGCDSTRFRQSFGWALFRVPGDELTRAIDRLNAAHRLVRSTRPTDANMALLWLNPMTREADRQLLAQVEPVALPLRQAEEQAIELIERARPQARMNSVLLDEYVFTARRLHDLGQRIRLASRIPELYRQALANQGSREGFARALAGIGGARSLLVEARERSVALRAEYQRLWLRDNRPAWLGNILAQFDRDIRIWTDQIDAFGYYEVLVRLGKPLPSSRELGLGQ